MNCLDTEKVTHTAGVPTVWLMLLNHMAAGNLKLPHLQHAWSAAARRCRAR